MQAARDALTSTMMACQQRDGAEPEFLQAVGELLSSIAPVLAERPDLADVLPRLVEPERMISFRVPWVDDEGVVRVNRGYRVQMSSALGPYKGGLRFHPTVTPSVLKFLAFEQVFKNSLTSLPLGGGKGGADFNPKGRSDGEVMRFCQSFMTELHGHIGERLDVPAGDINVGAREIGYLFGQYKRLQGGAFSGALTGKSPLCGGSPLRPEATGYGLVYFVEEMLASKGETLAGKTVAISGAGNVALFAARRVTSLGGRVVSVSDSGGTLHCPEGFDEDALDRIAALKDARGRLSEHACAGEEEYHGKVKPWAVASARGGAEVCLPCATQNEFDEQDALAAIAGGARVVAEGANMPCTPSAVAILKQEGVGFGPAKAANAGGVAVSGFEMSQNALHGQWTAEEVDAKLRATMRDIHASAAAAAAAAGSEGDLQVGANCAGFARVAEAMLWQGVV